MISPTPKITLPTDESYGIFRCSGRGTPWRRETDKMNPPTIYGLWGSGPMDVWAVGLLAYHFLTGTFYWRAASTEGSSAPGDS